MNPAGGSLSGRSTPAEFEDANDFEGDSHYSLPNPPVPPITNHDTVRTILLDSPERNCTTAELEQDAAVHALLGSEFDSVWTDYAIAVSLHLKCDFYSVCSDSAVLQQFDLDLREEICKALRLTEHSIMIICHYFRENFVVELALNAKMVDEHRMLINPLSLAQELIRQVHDPESALRIQPLCQHVNAAMISGVVSKQLCLCLVEGQKAYHSILLDLKKSSVPFQALLDCQNNLKQALAEVARLQNMLEQRLEESGLKISDNHDPACIRTTYTEEAPRRDFVGSQTGIDRSKMGERPPRSIVPMSIVDLRCNGSSTVDNVDHLYLRNGRPQNSLMLSRELKYKAADINLNVELQEFENAILSMRETISDVSIESRTPRAISRTLNFEQREAYGVLNQLDADIDNEPQVKLNNHISESNLPVAVGIQFDTEFDTFFNSSRTLVAFNLELQRAICSALGIPKNALQVLCYQRGSLCVEIAICPHHEFSNDESCASDTPLRFAERLARQSCDASSSLRHSPVGRHLLSAEIHGVISAQLCQLVTLSQWAVYEVLDLRNLKNNLQSRA